MHVCSCRVAQGRKTYFLLLPPLEEHYLLGRIMMNTVSAVGAVQTTSASSCEDEKGAQSLKVRACMRTLSAVNDSMRCSLACRHACRVMPGCPTLMVTFFDHQSRTTGPAVPMLADAIGACRTLRPCGQGGYKARAAARECLGAPM